MRCALINNSTGLVENVIIADPTTDPHPEGYLLMGLQDDDPVSIGWIWDGAIFVDPIPVNSE
jgi:hypothetical protein